MSKKKFIFDCFIISACAIISAFAFQLFVAPNNFAPAGLGGIAMMIEYLFGHMLGDTPLFGYFTLIINVPLSIFAYFCISKEFGFKSFLFCGLTSVAYILIELIPPSFISSISYVASDAGEAILPCAIGGILSGVNYGVVIRLDASTGGTDIFAKYASKKNPLLNFFWVGFILNVIVAVTSFFVYAYDPITGAWNALEYRPVVLCVFYCFLSAFVGNMILKGTQSAYKFLVITTHADEIDKEIIEKLHHGATKLEGVGVYTGEKRDVLVCVVGKHEVVEFKNILSKYPDTFSFVENVTETIGLFRRK